MPILDESTPTGAACAAAVRAAADTTTGAIPIPFATLPTSHVDLNDRVPAATPTVLYRAAAAARGNYLITSVPTDFEVGPCVLNPTDLDRLDTFIATRGPVAPNWTRTITRTVEPFASTAGGPQHIVTGPVLEVTRTDRVGIHVTWRTGTTDADTSSQVCFEWLDPPLDYPRWRQWVPAAEGMVDWALATTAAAEWVCGVGPVANPLRVMKRADELLMSLLDPAQQQSYRQEKSFVVEAPSGTRYRIRLGITGNIEELGADDRAIRRLCVHPVGVPMPDVLATQKLMLETNEAEFRRIANITDVHTGRMVPRAAG